MPSHLLATKFYVPRHRTGLVPRPSLTDRLLGGTEAKLILISAPAGFGKSTLLAEWLATPTDGALTAWLSLDAGDDHPSQFWPHLIASLQTAIPGVGTTSLALFESPDRSVELILAPLLNELAGLSHDVVLVLDDYHVIDSQDIHLSLSFVLDHLPARMRLVIATRVDPALPLARMRARGDLVEIRASDLRFTPDEAGAYFNGVMGLGLTAPDVAALESRTEGWIAALHLAGLSMQGRDDPAGFIASFAGDDRYIVDYLVEEVLQRQTERVRTFLLQTSILSRLNGSLSDAVTGQVGGKAMLEALERRNLLLIPLDDRRDWYRYHHLFADVLQARLRDEQPELVGELHRRATEWFEQNGERAEAIRHAMAAKDFARAADLVELAMPDTGRERQEATLRQWLEGLPDEVIRARPVLSNGYAGSLLVRGETQGVEARLQDAERWLHVEEHHSVGDPASDMVVVDEDAFRTLPARISMHRAGLARLRGDIEGTISHARRTRELVGADDDLGQGAASTLLGLAYWTRGDLEAASDLYVGAMARFETVGYRSDAVGLALSLADMRLAQGRLHDAMETYERGLEIAARGPILARGAADMHVGISEVLRQRDDLVGAEQHLQQARELGDENGLPQNPYRLRVAAAGIRWARGDVSAALELLGEADRLYFSDFSPDVRPVGAVRARVWLSQGRVPEAQRWARERGLSATDDLTYVREFEHATLARVLLAQGFGDAAKEPIRAAIELTERLLAAAQDGGRNGSAVDILIVQALAFHAAGDPDGAKAALDRAIDIAEPEGYVRSFIEEGPSMVALLKFVAKDRNAPGYVRQLLAASTVARPGEGVSAQPLIEPLSERELEVLRLLQSDLDGPAIARELTVSLPTVRTHTSNIYSKLGVTNRRAAVRRAGELGLLSATSDRA
jgi:LuxR family maltose regulon positive regulatory protein